MNIIFGKDPSLESKYVLLELDTLLIPGSNDPVTAYCVLEQIPLTEMSGIDNLKSLHENLLKNYKLKNWKFCEDALEYLIGKWNREVDSFYIEMQNRITQLKTNGVPDDWTGIVDRTKDIVRG